LDERHVANKYLRAEISSLKINIGLIESKKNNFLLPFYVNPSSPTPPTLTAVNLLPQPDSKDSN